MNPQDELPGYANILADVSGLLETSRRLAARAINTAMTKTYWEIGRRIVEFEQGGSKRAEYGRQVIRSLSNDLTERFGRGFSKRNIDTMRKFYLVWSNHSIDVSAVEADDSRIVQTVSAQFDFASSFELPWSHYVTLLGVGDPSANPSTSGRPWPEGGPSGS